MSVRSGWRRDLLITAALFIALLAWDASGLDPMLTRGFGDAQGFSWRDHWFTRGVLHEGGRWLAWLVLGALVVNVPRPLMAGPTRAERLRMLLLTLACVVVVALLKQGNATSCPWDLAEFGGTASWVSHRQFGLPDGGPGRCFPSGHATAAFAFFGGYTSACGAADRA